MAKHAHPKLTLHVGDDYACIMQPGEVTDTAFILVRHPSREDVALLSVLTAAPEMLEALREARSGLIAHTGGNDGACGETIARIGAAIAKAGG